MIAQGTKCLHAIKTHGSKLRGQEEASLRDEPVSYVQVALLPLNKLP